MSSINDGQPDDGRPSLVSLPEGVSLAAWDEEKTRFQNPRIRAFLACNQRLERVRDSNYAILHCSPARVSEMISSLREVAVLIRTGIKPLLREPSSIPELERARSSAEGYVRSIEQEVLAEIDRLPTQIREDRLGDVRKALCVWIGKLHAFLVDCESDILAADPRGRRDAESFATRKPSRDVEEAGWLHASVLRLQAVLEGIEQKREACLVQHASQVSRAGRVLDPEASGATTAFVGALRDSLVPRLREVLNLRGIRVGEIELLETHAAGLLQECAVALELQAIGERLLGEAAGEERAAAVLGARFAEIVRSINRRVRDLGTFVAVWQRLIAKRRSILLTAEAEGAATRVG